MSFVLMTFLILCFFIMSPITPSDKAGHTYGRESLSPEDDTAAETTTLAGESVEVSKGTSTITVTTTRKEYKITITTGTNKYSDYYSEGRINAGGYEGEYTTSYYQTTSTAYGTEPYTGYIEPTTGYGEEPYTGEDPTEPVTGEYPTESITQPPTEAPTQAPTQPIITQAPTEAPKPTEVSEW